MVPGAAGSSGLTATCWELQGLVPGLGGERSWGAAGSMVGSSTAPPQLQGASALVTSVSYVTQGSLTVRPGPGVTVARVTGRPCSDELGSAYGAAWDHQLSRGHGPASGLLLSSCPAAALALTAAQALCPSRAGVDRALLFL